MIFTSHEVMSPEDAKGLLAQLLELQWEEGKARTERLTGTIKQNREVQMDTPIAKTLSKFVSDKWIGNEAIQRRWFPKKMAAVRFNRYAGGGTYHRHTDSALMGDVRTDLASTIFLSDPESYEGGELCVEVNGTIHSHKGKAGECVVYPCSYPHWVNPVTKGERISGFTWIESIFQNEKQREILRNVQSLCLALDEKMNPADESDPLRKLFVDAGQIHGDLMRMWM